MSYLTLPKGVPDFTKAVISLWFRVPQISIDNCVAATIASGFPSGALPGSGPPYLPLISVIPLLTFGGPVTWQIYHGPLITVDPSYIGLFCAAGGGGFNVASFAFNLQTDGYPTTSLYGSEDVPPIPDSAFDAEPGMYNNYASGFIPQLVPNKWHHVLVSFDLSNGCVTSSGYVDSGGDAHVGAVSAYSNFWYAIDDVNYPGTNASSVFSSRDQSMILTDLGNNIAAFTPSEIGVVATYNLAGSSIPAGAGPIGVPASKGFVENVLQVEMAEFQMFTGVTLDTSVVSNRRAFIDKNGKPVSPMQRKSQDGKTPSGSEELLGKIPEVLLHGAGNWKSGKNTGSLGVDKNGNLIKSGQFEPTGRIIQFKPDPQLGK